MGRREGETGEGGGEGKNSLEETEETFGGLIFKELLIVHSKFYQLDT